MHSAVQTTAIDCDGPFTENERPAAEVPAALRALHQRGHVGDHPVGARLPHSSYFDEPHTLPIGEDPWADAFSARCKGFCLSTYLPDRLPTFPRTSTDLLVL